MGRPSCHPTSQPTRRPTAQPTSQPSQQPSQQPTSHPTYIEIESTSETIRIQSAYISTDYSSIDLVINTPTNEFGGPGIFACSQLLFLWSSNTSNSRSANLLDNISSCRWKTSSSVNIVPIGIGAFSGLVSFQSLYIRIKNTTASLNGLFVSKPIDSSYVKLQKSAARNFDTAFTCLNGYVTSDQNNIIVDATNCVIPNFGISWRNGLWTVRNATSNINTLPFSIELSRQARASDTGMIILSRSLVLPSSLSTGSFSIVCTLCIRNGTGCSENRISMQMNAFINALTSAPVVRIFPWKSVMMYNVLSDLVLIGDAYVLGTTSSEVRRTNLIYNWSVTEISSSRSYIVLETTMSSNPQILRIAAKHLSAWKRFNVTLLVTDMVSGRRSQSTKLNLVTILPSIIISTNLMQSHVVLGSTDTLDIDASGTLDSSSSNSNSRRLQSTSSTLVFHWFCSSYVQYYGRKTLSPSAECALNLSQSSDGRRLQLKVLASFSNVNSTNLITLVVKDSAAISAGYNRTSAKTFTFTVVPKVVPVIRLLTSLKSLERVSTTGIVRIDTSVKMSNLVPGSQNSSCLWLASGGIELLNAAQASSILVATIRPGQLSQMPLIIKSNFLISSAHYVFRLSCGSAFMDVSVSTNQPPYGGSVLVYPENGTAIRTEFSMLAVGWKDDSMVDDMANAIPLVYVFEYKTSALWITIPNFVGSTLVDRIFLPQGQANESYRVLIRVKVSDSLQATSATEAVTKVSPMTTNGTLGTVSYMTAMIRNASMTSSLKTQQLATSLLTYLQDKSVSLTPSQGVAMASLLLRVTNASLLTTDLGNLDIARQLLRRIGQYSSQATIALTQAQAKDKLAALLSSQSNKNTTGSSSNIVTQTNNVVSFLADSLLNGGGSSITVVSDTVRVTVSVVSFDNTSSATIAVPDSKSTVSINSPESGSNALISVVEYDASIWGRGGSSNSTNSTTTSKTPTLSSDILSLRVSYLGNDSNPVLPSFVANLSVSGTTHSQIFKHNCTVGKKEFISFFCIDAKMTMNLTCSGKVAASVHRTCPVAQRSCSVLSAKTQSISSSDYCHAASTSSGSIICKCGFSGKNSSVSSILEGGAVNLAITTQFSASANIGGSIAIAASSFGGNIAQKSSTVFAVFGCLWGMGCLLVGVVFMPDETKKQILVKLSKKQSEHQITLNKIVPKTTSNIISLETNKPSIVEFQKKLRKYLLSLLPHVYHSHPWWHRLLLEIRQKHILISVIFDAIQFRDSSHSFHSRRKEDLKKINNVLRILELLTSITLSFFVLAIIFDFQYPVDDGSCAAFVTRSSCLTRKTLLDPTVPFCAWEPLVTDSAGFITEYQNGQKLESMTLETMLGTNENTEPSCKFNVNSSSFLAFVISVIIVTAISEPIGMVLSFLFRVVRVQPSSHKDDQIHSIGTRESLALKNDTCGWFIRFLQTFHFRRRKSQILPITSLTYSSRRRTESAESHASDSSDICEAGLSRERVESFESDVANDAQPPGNESKGRHWILQYFYDSFMWKKSIISLVHVEQEQEEVRQDCAQLFALSMQQQQPQAVSPIGKVAPHGDETEQTKSGKKRRHSLSRKFSSWTKRVLRSGQLDLIVQEEAALWKTVLNSRHNDAEYGVIVMLTLLADMLRAYPASRKLFMSFVRDEYLTKYAKSHFWANAFMVLIFMLNFGALYFVALKGMSRGLTWQRNFLQGCLLDLVAEMAFVQIMEIWWIDFFLPSLIAKEVKSGWNQMLRISESFVVAAVRGKLVFQKPDKDATQKVHLSHLLAYDQVKLLESQLALHYKAVEVKQQEFKLLSVFTGGMHKKKSANSPVHKSPHSPASSGRRNELILKAPSETKSEANIPPSPVEEQRQAIPPPRASYISSLVNHKKQQQQQSHGAKLAYISWRKRCISFFVGFPLEVHRFSVCVVSAVFIGAGAYVWFALRHVSLGYLYLGAVIVGMIVLIVSSVYLFTGSSCSRSNANRIPLLTKKWNNRIAIDEAECKVLRPNSRWKRVRDMVMSGAFREQFAGEYGDDHYSGSFNLSSSSSSSFSHSFETVNSEEKKSQKSSSWLSDLDLSLDDGSEKSEPKLFEQRVWQPMSTAPYNGEPLESFRTMLRIGYSQQDVHNNSREVMNFNNQEQKLASENLSNSPSSWSLSGASDSRPRSLSFSSFSMSIEIPENSGVGMPGIVLDKNIVASPLNAKSSPHSIWRNSFPVALDLERIPEEESQQRLSLGMVQYRDSQLKLDNFDSDFRPKVSNVVEPVDNDCENWDEGSSWSSVFSGADEPIRELNNTSANVISTIVVAAIAAAASIGPNPR